MKRVSRRDHRPLLKEADPEAVMRRLMEERYPIYAEADITVETDQGPHNVAAAEIITALRAHLAGST
jgi:shikimate kinase